MPTAVMGALGLREVSGRAPVDTLAEHLRQSCALVVLDNCEHLAPACSELAERLLQACPSLTILATSRAPLGAAGETTWRAVDVAASRTDGQAD